MRILVVNSFFPPLTTGSAHFSFDLAQAYKKYGHEVVVLTSRPDDALESEKLEGVTVWRVPTKWWSLGRLSFNYSLPTCSSFSAIFQVFRKMREYEPDVIHQHGQFFDLTLISSLFATRNGLPRVLTVHTPLVHTQRFARYLIAAIDRTILKFFVRLGRSEIVAVDRFTMELCQRRYKPKNPPVSFVPAAIKIDAFASGAPDRIRERFRLSGKRVILSFGHVIPLRSRVPLILALKQILERVPEAHLLVVGHVYDWTFMRLAQTLGVAEHVTIVGRVPHVDVPDYLAIADIEAHDLDTHGLGMTTFEVMAAGVPVIANVQSDVFPGIDLKNWPEVRIYSNLDTNELAQKIIELLEASKAELKVITDQQFQFLETNFSVEVIAENYLDRFERLISPPNVVRRKRLPA